MITPSLCYVHFLPVPWNHSLPPEPHHSNCMRGQDVQSVTGWRVDWLHMQLSFGLRSGHRLQNSVLCVITIGPGAGLVPWLTRAPPYCGLLSAKLVRWPGHFPALHGSPHAKAWSPVYWISPSKGLHSSSSPASLTFYCLKVRGKTIPATTLKCSVNWQQNENSTPWSVTITRRPNTPLLGNYLKKYSDIWTIFHTFITIYQNVYWDRPPSSISYYCSL